MYVIFTYSYRSKSLLTFLYKTYCVYVMYFISVSSNFSHFETSFHNKSIPNTSYNNNNNNKTIISIRNSSRYLKVFFNITQFKVRKYFSFKENFCKLFKLFALEKEERRWFKKNVYSSWLMLKRILVWSIFSFLLESTYYNLLITY